MKPPVPPVMMRAHIILILVVAVQAAAANLIAPQIVGGDEAAPHQFPWQAALSILRVDGYIFCGGSLIDKRWVVTAAHCVTPVDKIISIELALGAHVIGNNTEEGRIAMQVQANNVIVHPTWKEDSSWAGDIALLHLPEDVPQSEIIKIVRLPTAAQKKESFWRETATISGWGTKHTRDKEVAPVLRYTSNKVVSNFFCKLCFLFLLAEDTNICISGWGLNGACKGDSGGPMVIYGDDGEPTLIGVSSFGLGLGCHWGWPSAYTRITSYLDWINSNIQNYTIQT